MKHRLTLPHVCANASVCMYRYIRMCLPIHTYVFAVRCIIFRRNLLDLSVKPSKGFTEIFLCQECKQMIEILCRKGVFLLDRDLAMLYNVETNISLSGTCHLLISNNKCSITKNES